MVNIDVDLSMLKGVLKNANKVMNKVESGDYSKKSNDTLINEDYNVDYQEPKTQRKVSPNNDVYKERLEKTKLPEKVKKAMLEQPIEMPEYNGGGLSESDLYDDEDRMPEFTPDTTKQQLHERLEQKRQHLRSNMVNKNMVTVDRNELNTLIQENVVKFLSIYFTKNITEKSVKQTLKQMLSEGKLKTK